MSSYSLRIKKEQYYSLLNNVNIALSYINTVHSNISDCNSINSYYIVNNVTADHNVIGTVRDNSDNIINTLRDEVIPWIENKIRSLDNEIQQAEIEEATMNNI